MKKIVFILFFFLLCAFSPAAAASSSASASNSSEGFSSLSGLLTSSSYSGFSSAGEDVNETLTSASYHSWSGLAAIIYAPSISSSDAAAPRISNIKFNGFTIKNNDDVSASPAITAAITDESGIDTTKTSIEVDGVLASVGSLASPNSFSSATGKLAYSPSFADGQHTFKIYAYDLAGNSSSSEALTFIVSGGDLKIEGSVVNYPNPFSPPAQATTITYMLNKDADVMIYIFNIIGQLVKKIEKSSGSEGARAGYNQVSWDGISDFNEVLPNDVYLCRVVSGGKVIGKCKIAILK
ncbi:hypothetical protein HZC34_03030 [Candidatus Saganbacteria bacterium]|nr:hypothetical protein [Candidatus Saganbacteria bacterium]